MALDKMQFENFKNKILKASKELQSNQLTYISEWVYLLPSHSLEINGKMIDYTYDIPSGWDGYGLQDLYRLVNEGILEFVKETKEEPNTLQKAIFYKVRHQ